MEGIAGPRANNGAGFPWRVPALSLSRETNQRCVHSTNKRYVETRSRVSIHQLPVIPIPKSFGLLALSELSTGKTCDDFSKRALLSSRDSAGLLEVAFKPPPMQRSFDRAR
jgi:hypothetical protein